MDALKHQPTPLTQLKPTLSMNANANDKLNRAAQFNAMAPPLAKADFTVDKGVKLWLFYFLLRKTNLAYEWALKKVVNF